METYLFTSTDLFKVVSNAKQNISNFSLPIYVSNKEVEYKEIITLAVIESVLMHLNSKNLLTKSISVDYTNISANFEIEEE